MLKVAPFIPGGLLLAFGLAVAIYSTRYNLGSPSQMGPGFFPFALSITLMVLSGGVLALERSHDRMPPQLSSVVYMSVAILVLALTLESLGLWISSTISMLLLTSAYRESPLAVRLTISLLVPVALVIGFVVLLRMNIPSFPTIF